MAWALVQAPGSPNSQARGGRDVASKSAMTDTAPVHVGSSLEMSATLRSRHAPQPSFSDMVGHGAPAQGEAEVELAGSGLPSSMPSFDRLSPETSRGDVLVGSTLVHRQGSQPETPTLAARVAPPPPPSPPPQRSPASRPSGPARKAGPTAESLDKTTRAPSVPPASPFDTAPQGRVDVAGDSTMSMPLTQPLAPSAGGPSMHDGTSGTTATQVYVPPSGADVVATPASAHVEVGGSGGGGESSVRQLARPAPLVIDNPADAASVVASSHHNTLRYGQCDVVIDAVANDRTVVDAEEEYGRTNVVAGMPSEAVVGVPSRMGPRQESFMEDGPLSAGPVQPLKWWVARPGGEGGDGEGAAMWLSTKKRGPRLETWYDSEAILSRKPSVRFRRTVDLMTPVYNDEVRAERAVRAVHACM